MVSVTKPPSRAVAHRGRGRSIVSGLLVTLAMLTAARAGLDPTTDKILYEVATAHLDTQWNWTIQQTINNYIPNTLRQNFAFFTNYPHYTFTFEGAFRYRLAKEYYPADYAILKHHVAQGRWRVGGSAVDAGDVNIPSPESLIRQILYGNGFWQQEFGQSSVDVFLPDCFGFGYALPSVAAHCGLKGFSSQKLSWGSAIPLPFPNIGRWLGPDGNAVVAALDPGAYVSTIGGNLANDASALNRIANMGAATGLFIDYRYFGTGDVGGAPTQASVDWLEQSVTTAGNINVISAGSDQLFRDLTPTHLSRLPSYQGELLMRTHGTGCYTAHPEMKQYNRQNELRADAAERLAVMADWAQGGGTYPRAQLTRAWERFLWHQFHDDLTGTSIPEAYTFSWNDELLSLNEFNSVTRHGLGMLAKALDTTAMGIPVVVYNPLSLARQDIVEARVRFTNGPPTAVRVFDGNGVEVPSQIGAPVGEVLPVTFLAQVPAMGLAVYDVRPAAAPTALNTGLSVTASQLEIPRYRVRLNASGDVSSIFDKRLNRELLSAPIRWAFLANASTSWPAWEVLYSTLNAAPISHLGGTPIIEINEQGPARVGLSVTRFNSGSSFTERIRLAAGGAGDRVEWDVSVNWGTRGTLLKLVLPLTATNSSASYDLGLGVISRPDSTSSSYEFPAQQWADLTRNDGEFGVTILNDCRYGWDKPNDRTLRLTMFHTPAVGSAYTYQATDGFGSHHLGFAVAGHTNDWRIGGSSWLAARFNQPLLAFQTTQHAGTLGSAFSFLTCNNSNVMVKALKKAEQGDEVIVRLQELSGTPQNAQLAGASAITAARQVTGAETPLATLAPVAGHLDVSLGGFAPMTVALTLATNASPVEQPASIPLPLPFNVDAISTDGNRTDGNFDQGYTYPAELLPSTVVREGIAFQIGPTNDGVANAVACQGQTLPLVDGYDRLYLLAAAASNDVNAVFTMGGNQTNLLVPYFAGFFGQWSPPFLKQAEVGWVCSHRHTGAGANDAYRFCYLFKLSLPVPAGATSLTLPNLPNVRIFAASLAKNTAEETVAIGGPPVQNLMPWADAGPNRSVNADPSGVATVVLDGRSSTDPDGQIVAYTWSTNGAVIASGAQATASLPLGTHEIQLTVTDAQGGTGLDVLSVTVLPPLEVAIVAVPTNGPPPLSVNFAGQFNGEGLIVPVDTTDDLAGSISAQGENGPNETAARVFDNNTSTKWLDFANANPGTRASWIQYQFASGSLNLVSNYTLTSANDAPARDPADWRLLGSNNGGTDWITLDVRTNQAFGARFQKRSFLVAAPGAYNLYRLQIDKVANPASANSVQLAELELIGLPMPIYHWTFGDGATSSAQSPQHTYANPGNYRAELGVTYGNLSGTSGVLITVGPPLAALLTASPTNTAPHLPVHFVGLASGGNGSRPPFDTTDDHYGIITAQGENPPNEVAGRAFDNLSTTKWLDFANAFPDRRSTWVQYQYANDVRYVVSAYSITSANDATTYAARNPRDWRLLASNDGGATWTTLDLRTNQGFTANYQKLTYTIPNTDAFNVYRFVVDSVSNSPAANSMQLAELEFIGQSGYSYFWNFGDGSTSNERNPEHAFATNGNYLVTLTVSDGAAASSTAAIIHVLPLNLSAASVGGGALQLSWPAWADAFRLYAATNLTPPVTWLPSQSPITNLGNGFSTTIFATNGQRYFRLAVP